MACGRDQPGRPLRRYGHRNETGGGQLTTCGIGLRYRCAVQPCPYRTLGPPHGSEPAEGSEPYRKIRRMGFSLCRVGVCGLPAVAGCASIAGSPLRAGGETGCPTGSGSGCRIFRHRWEAAQASILRSITLGRFRFRRRGYRCSEAEQAFVDFLGLLSRIASADGAFGALFGRAAGSRRVVPSDGAVRQVSLRTTVADAQR